jgi:ribosome-binding factor A
VADRIMQVLAEVLDRHTEDPRLRTITVTGARVSRDLGVARVWVTGRFGPTEEAGVLAALQHATPRLRSLLAPELRLRIVPHLNFVIDHSSETGARIEELLRGIREERHDAPDAAAGADDDEAPNPESEED